MNKFSLKKSSSKTSSKEGKMSIKLPKGIKVHQLVLAVASVIFLALTVYFSYTYFQGLNTKNDLTNDIQQKKAAIAAKPLKTISELQTSLEDARANLSKNSPFPTSVDNKEVVAQLLQVGKDANIPNFGYPLSSSSATTLGTVTYTEKTYSISVGTASKLQRVINFLKNLEELPYNTSYVDGLRLGKAGDLWTFSLKFNVILQKQ